MLDSAEHLGLSLLATALAAFVAAPSQAQTPTTTIQNGNANTRLQLNYDGGLLVPGFYRPTTPNDSIPATGPGTRLMWYPAKAAFRVGRINASAWDATNIGLRSIAFGTDTQADGLSSTAMGEETTASGSYSTAMGTGSIASGFYSVAMGNHTVAGTGTSLAFGQCNSANQSSDNTLLVAGNGTGNATGCDSRSDALVLDQSGNLTISGSLNENSDRRLKEDVRPLGAGVLKKLGRLRPVRFRFKNQRTHPSGEQLGLIAQDVREEFPSLVSKGSGGYLSLAYPKMTAVLLKGLQEQQAQLDDKQAQIDSLKEKVRQIQDVKKRLAALETGRSPSVVAGLAGSGTSLLLAFLLGGLLGAGLIWRRRG